MIQSILGQSPSVVFVQRFGTVGLEPGTPPPLSNDQPCLTTGPPVGPQLLGPTPGRTAKFSFFVLRIAFWGGRTATFGEVWGGRTAYFSGPPVGPRTLVVIRLGGGG